VELQGWAEGTTSNRMELTAALEGLKSIQVPSDIVLVSDSTYLIKAFRQNWIERWMWEEECGNRTKPRTNMDLWHQLYGLNKYHNVSFIKIKGHSGDYWNERADRLADEARRSKVSNTHINKEWIENIRCESMAPNGSRQCKLHQGHTGRHYWTNGKANGVEIYGTSAVSV
jgi:ribonuclease HI